MREDRVGAPLRRIGRAALRLAAAAPLVGEQHLGAVVVERRRVPVREVRVGDGGDAHGMRGIADVEQQAVALARAAGEADRRIDRDVVALRRARTRAVGRPAAGPIMLRDDRRKRLRAARRCRRPSARPLPPRALTMLSSIGVG